MGSIPGSGSSPGVRVEENRTHRRGKIGEIFQQRIHNESNQGDSHKEDGPFVQFVQVVFLHKLLDFLVYQRLITFHNFLFTDVPNI